MNMIINRLCTKAIPLFFLTLSFATADGQTDVELIKAADKGDSATVESLIAKGANVNAKYVVNDWTALFMASQNGHSQVVKMLLDNGADVNCKTSNGGWTPLIIASQNGHTAVVKLLLEKGADVDAKASFGKRGIAVVEVTDDGKQQSKPQSVFVTALGQAKKNGHQDIVEILEKAGAGRSESTLSISKVVVRLQDGIDQAKEEAGRTIIEVPVHWIPKEHGSPLGNTYRTLATPQTQRAFLTRLKSPTGEITFTKIRNSMTTALSERLRAAGRSEVQPGATAMTLTVSLRILPGPWGLTDPFASVRRQGMLVSPTVTIDSPEGQVVRRLDVEGILVEERWQKVIEAIALLSADLVSSMGTLPR